MDDCPVLHDPLHALDIFKGFIVPLGDGRHEFMIRGCFQIHSLRGHR